MPVLQHQSNTPFPYLRRVPQLLFSHRSILSRFGASEKPGAVQVIAEEAARAPDLSTNQDNFIGRVLWALSDNGAGPAKTFARLVPAPPIDWLEWLLDERFSDHDLSRFDVTLPPTAALDRKFSYASRPAAVELNPRMELLTARSEGVRWDSRMQYIGEWLLRYLGNRRLLHAVVGSPGRIHTELSDLISRRLNELAAMSPEERAQLLKGSPDAFPSNNLRRIWMVLVHQKNGRDSSPWADINLRELVKHRANHVDIQLEVSRAFAPTLKLKPPWDEGGRLGQNQVCEAEPPISKLVDSDVVLGITYPHNLLGELREQLGWQDALQHLAGLADRLLLDAVSLMELAGTASAGHDLSYLHRPSISNHEQNNDFRGWTALIELARDSWQKLYEHDRELALHHASAWWGRRFPVFKRLAIFAALQDDELAVECALNWLPSEDWHWLWSVETKRETLQWLRTRFEVLPPKAAEKIQKAVVVGPPDAIFREGLSNEDLERGKAHEQWLVLSKIDRQDGVLSAEAGDLLERLRDHYPQWQLSNDQREEFPVWTGSGDEWTKYVRVPRQLAEMQEWLIEHPESLGPWTEDDWDQACRDDLELTATALKRNLTRKQFSEHRWTAALHAWSTKEHALESWVKVGDAVRELGDEFQGQLISPLSRWLRSIAESDDAVREEVIEFVAELLPAAAAAQGGMAGDDEIMFALNHPIGDLTQTVLHYWFHSGLEDRCGLSPPFRGLFERVLSGVDGRCFAGRTLLTAKILTFHRVDREWTSEWLVPNFSWASSRAVAKASWKSFLWSPRVYRPLLDEMREQLVTTAHHFDELGEHASNYVAFMTYVMLDGEGLLTRAERATVLRELPRQAFSTLIRTLSNAVRASEKNADNYWTNRARDLSSLVIAQLNDGASANESEAIVTLCLALRESFPDAVTLFRDILHPVEFFGKKFNGLSESGKCAEYPEPALALLYSIVDGNTYKRDDELQTCLRLIEAANPDLAHDYRYRRLRDYC